MDSLDDKLDVMKSKKITSLMQENSVRLIKINIRFTKNNQKYTIDRMNERFKSYEKMLREIIRQPLKMEKEIRMKYVVSLEADRKLKIMKDMNSEIEMTIQKMVKDLRLEYSNLGQEKQFDEKIRQITVSAKENFTSQMDKLEEKLSQDLSRPEKIPPHELSRIFKMDESALVDLKAITPLQYIHEIFNCRKEDERYMNAYDGITQAILECVGLGDSAGAGMQAAHTVDARRAKKKQIISGTLLLKDLIDDVHTLVKQLGVPPEQRNEEVIRKVWKRLSELVGESPETREILNHLQLVYDLFGFKE